LLTGIHDVFHTTRTSFSPDTDVRSARISWTSQMKPSLEQGDGDDDVDLADMNVAVYHVIVLTMHFENAVNNNARTTPWRRMSQHE